MDLTHDSVDKILAALWPAEAVSGAKGRKGARREPGERTVRRASKQETTVATMISDHAAAPATSSAGASSSTPSQQPYLGREIGNIWCDGNAIPLHDGGCGMFYAAGLPAEREVTSLWAGRAMVGQVVKLASSACPHTPSLVVHEIRPTGSLAEFLRSLATGQLTCGDQAERPRTPVDRVQLACGAGRTPGKL